MAVVVAFATPAAAQALPGVAHDAALFLSPPTPDPSPCFQASASPLMSQRVAPLSALDRMRQDQGDAAAPPRSAVIAPAMLTPVVPAAAFSARVDCGTDDPRGATPAESGLELGTVAIPIDRTRFDDRWNRVRPAPPARVLRAALARAGVGPGLGDAAMLEQVNRWVNRTIAYVTDDRALGQRDVWATAAETLASGRGDCEDFAILKMHLLRAAGVAGDRMKLVLLRDLSLNADHALLLVRSGAGHVVLDNVTDRLYDGSQSTMARPILSFSGSRAWIHGYRDAPSAPIVRTAARVESQTLVASARPDLAGRATWMVLPPMPRPTWALDPFAVEAMRLGVAPVAATRLSGVRYHQAGLGAYGLSSSG